MADFAVLVDRRVKLKESEKKDKHLDLTGVMKRVWNIENDDEINCNCCSLYNQQRLKQRLEDLDIRERVETIQTTASLKSAWILRIVWDIWGDLQSLKLQWENIG